MSNSKTAISTKDAPAAIGPYSQAVRIGNFLYTSGQVALDPVTGALVSGGVKEQTARVVENLKAVLAAGGLTFANVVRCTLYVVDLDDFSKINEAYGQFFDAPPPARATVQVAALPRGARVEIDAIAVS